jgi:hypothetical protein
MIEESIYSGKYLLDQEIEKQMTGLVQVINRSSSDDLKEKDIKIEVRLNQLYVLNNYIQSIQHLSGVIKIDALDSFKMLRNLMFHFKDKSKMAMIDRTI